MADSLRYKDWFERAIQDLHGKELIKILDGAHP